MTIETGAQPGNIEPTTAPTVTPTGTPAPVKEALPVNPMLSRVSQPAPIEPAPTAPATTVPDAPPIIKIPTTTAQEGTVKVADLAQTYANDPQVKLATDYVDNIIKGTDVDLARVIGQVAETLDPRFIDRAYLKEKLGDKADGVISTLESIVSFVSHQQEQALKSVYALAGSEDGWFNCLEAYKKVADPVEVETLAGLMNSGDSAKIEYAAKKIIAAGQASGAVLTHQAALLGQPGGLRGVSAAEYREAVRELAKNPRASEKQYSELREKRALGKRQNLN
jgi:hypothetical protein